MAKITKRELIAYCRRRESEVCNGCEYNDTACEIFRLRVGTIPYYAITEEKSEEVIEWLEIANGEQTERNC